MQYLLQQIKKNIDVQNRLYSYGVVYGKYRDYVAISSFCDYLSSGRCAQLDGPDGCYNLYEKESRDDLVIRQLDRIADSLDQIKENQYYIYNEIRKTNEELLLIGAELLVSNYLQAIQIKKLDQVIQNTDQIAYNTKVTAYYSKKNAELTNALGYLTALK